MNKFDHIQYIHKFLSDEMNGEERIGFKKWLSEENNNILFDQISQIWNESAKAPIVQFDAKKAFAKHTALLNQPQDKIEIEEPETKFVKLSFFKVAAAVLVTILVSVVVFNLTKGEDFTSIKSNEIAKAVELKDGSKVWLENGSEILVSNFTASSRTIKLNGKAYFDIASDKNAPFVIRTNELDVEVLGTQFLIDASQSAVIVKEGKVKVKHDDDVKLLSDNQQVSLSKGKLGEITQKSFNEVELWFNEELSFNNASFSKVISDISQKYKVKFELPNNVDLSSCTFTSGSLKNNTLDQILTTLQLTYDLEYNKIDKSTYKLSKVKCR